MAVAPRSNAAFHTAVSAAAAAADDDDDAASDASGAAVASTWTRNSRTLATTSEPCDDPMCAAEGCDEWHQGGDRERERWVAEGLSPAGGAQMG